MNRGWLRNGNLGGDWTKAARCGAKNRLGLPCQCPAMQTDAAGFMAGRAQDQELRKESSASKEQ
jgi:hypothetical protein